MKTEDEINQAIAEHLGLLNPPKCKPSIEQLEAILADTKRDLKVMLLPNGEVRSVLNYCGSLDAMNELESHLTPQQWPVYLQQLAPDFHDWMSQGTAMPQAYIDICHAPALKKAIAWLAAIK